ncbi:hypothetical protein EV356DRAFT_138390 [Viridothelium virens]|uniref:Rhodopsin domain-containing protein n=1 Tax=Viridothelium virens TaxID=1048519 RepID=A0A6A6HAM0_VIRVR|nr:hypothetical protein EV356DRAFT_138390 [Viridothelium virens]
MASPDSEDAAYLAQDRQGQLIALNVVMATIATASVALRFYARKTSKAGYWWDDWMCLASLPITLTVNIFSAEFVDTGQGKHDVTLPWGDTRYLHQLYFELLFYNASLVFFKLSLLFLYNRVFSRFTWLKFVTWTLGVLIMMWLVAVEFVLIFQCSPLRRAWDEKVPGKCLNQKSLFIAQSVPTITFDVSVLSIAIPLVWMIQLPRSSKIALIGVFGMGGM